MINALLVSLIGLGAGGILGTVFGFAITSHSDVMRGVRPNTENRVILFLARPTSEMNLLEGLLLLVLMIVWLAGLVGLCAIPAIAADRLAGDGPPLIWFAYGGFVIACFLGRIFGAHAWRVMS